MHQIWTDAVIKLELCASGSTPTLCHGDPDDVRSDDTDRDQGAVHNLSVYELQERLAESERQEQQRMVDLEVFDSFQWQLHQLGKQAQMLNCVLNEQHLAQEALESELLEQMETFKNVHDSWTLLPLCTTGSDPQQCPSVAMWSSTC